MSREGLRKLRAVGSTTSPHLLHKIPYNVIQIVIKIKSCNQRTIHKNRNLLAGNVGDFGNHDITNNLRRLLKIYRYTYVDIKITSIDRRRVLLRKQQAPYSVLELHFITL